MVDELHDMGFKVTLWVMPFIEAGGKGARPYHITPLPLTTLPTFLKTLALARLYFLFSSHTRY